MSDIQVFNPLDQAIAEWLEAKTNKSNSQRTAQSYRDNMADFRAVLAERHADLLSDPRLVALVAEQWTASTRPIMRKDGTFIRQRQSYRLFVIPGQARRCVLYGKSMLRAGDSLT